MKAPERILRAVDDALARGEIGLQVAVYQGEQLVVDMCAGFRDSDRTRPVEPETLFTVFSATKAVTAVAVHVQAERGLLEYDQPVALYWPEFGTNGKASGTVRHVLTHAAGVPQMPPGTTAERMCDWFGMCEAIAALPALWEPGTRHGYHAYTFGWLCGELVRRTDAHKRSFRQFILDEIAAPLGIFDVWLGIPDHAEPRVAEIVDLEIPPGMEQRFASDSLLRQAVPSHLGTDRATFGRPDVRRSCHPGAGGIMNARGLARLYAMLANGGRLGSVSLLTNERIEAIRELQSDAVDAVIGRAYRRGMGVWLGRNDDSNSRVIGPNPGAFGHPGAGGAIGWCDPDAGLACAITKNRMLAPASPEENPLLAIAEAIREEFG